MGIGLQSGEKEGENFPEHEHDELNMVNMDDSRDRFREVGAKNDG